MALNQDTRDAGFRDDKDAAFEQPETTVHKPRLSEVRQLIAPTDAAFPKELAHIVYSALDCADFGRIICDAETKDAKVIIIRVPNDVIRVALEHPTQFRLAPAVLRNIPGVDYHPRFNQATYGCAEVNWSYIVDALGLDERLKFDPDAITKAQEAHAASDDVEEVQFDGGAGS